MPDDPIGRTHFLGVNVLTARLVLEGNVVGARSWKRLLVNNRKHLVLPDGCDESRRCREELGAYPFTLQPQHGVYALSTAPWWPEETEREGPDSHLRIGCVRWVSHEQGDFDGDNDFIRSCGNGIDQAHNHVINTRGGAGTPHLRWRCSLKRIDDPSVHVYNVGGKSVGLAAGLAAAYRMLALDECGTPQYIAATGIVDTDGKVLWVDHLIEKLEGLLREAPFVKVVCIPTANKETVPREIRDHLTIHYVTSLSEAINKLWPIKRPAPRPMGLDPRMHWESAMKIRVHCSTTPTHSFSMRLIFRIPLGRGAPNRIPGWRRLDRITPHGFFSNLQIEKGSDLAFRLATERRLVWQGDLPLAFDLDLNQLRNRTLVRHRGLTLRLSKVDLIPMTCGERCSGALSFCLHGGPCLVRDYLRWVSLRDFGGIEIVEAKTKSTPLGLRLGGVFSELTAAIQGNRKPDLTPMSVKLRLGQPDICQFLLYPEDCPWPEDGADPAFETARALVATCSRPNHDYPRVGGLAPHRWRDQKDTRFALDVYGFSAWAHAADEFNRTTKHVVIRDALYLLWLLASDPTLSDEEAGLIQRAIDLKVKHRWKFFQQCHRFFNTLRD